VTDRRAGAAAVHGIRRAPHVVVRLAATHSPRRRSAVLRRAPVPAGRDFLWRERSNLAGKRLRYGSRGAMPGHRSRFTSHFL
jgi:hypothetical protein